MNKEIEEKLVGYDPQKHKFAIYTPTADLAQDVASKFELTRHQWFYVKDIHDLWGIRNLYLLLYGNFMDREDFNEVWDYWERFMPLDCHYYYLSEHDLE